MLPPVLTYRRMVALIVVVTSIVLGVTNHHQVLATYQHTAATPPQLTLASGWPARYNGASNGAETPYDVTADSAGNVYVTGSSASADGSTEYATVKYNAGGTQLWAARYHGPGSGNNVASRIALDGTGNVYVTGTSAGVNTGQDLTTIKYSAAGQQLWVRRYNGPGNGDDTGNAIIVDGQGNVYVAGASVGVNTGNDATTIKYDANGNQLWIQRFDKGSRTDVAKYLVLSPQGGIYVVGASDGFSTIEDYLVLKYDEQGHQLWVQNYNGPGDWLDRAQQAVVDAAGNVYVVGTSIGASSDWDYATVKYAPDGTALWVRRYNGLGNGIDTGDSIVLDSAGRVYVAGVTQNAQGVPNYTTLCYTSDGDLTWLQRDSATATQYGEVLQLGVDRADNIYIAGSVAGATTGNDLMVLTYTATGTTVGVQQYTDTPNGDERTARGARALFVDQANNIYVSGWSDATGTSTDYLTLKYQSSSTQPHPTDTTSSPTITPTPSATTTPSTSTPTATPSTETPTTTSTPTVPSVTPIPVPSNEYAITINAGALFTNKINVTLTLTAKTRTTEMQVSNDGGFGNATWEPYTARKAWQITQYGQYVLPRIVYVRYRDAQGVVSPTYQDDILLDVTPPWGHIRWSNHLALASATDISSRLFLDASDDVSGVSDMRVSNQPDFTDVAWQPFTTTLSWESPAATVYVQFRDGAGNISATYTAQLNQVSPLFLPFVQR